LNLVNIEAALA